MRKERSYIHRNHTHRHLYGYTSLLPQQDAQTGYKCEQRDENDKKTENSYLFYFSLNKKEMYKTNQL